MHVYEGVYDGRNLRIGIVASRFNETIAKQLVDGVVEELRRHGVADDAVSCAWVPGAFEIPAATRRLALSGEFDALVCVGVVIRGETAHFEYVAGHASNGIGAVAMETGLPITNAILTTESVEQAMDRAGGKMGNKGAEAARAALEVVSLYSSLPKQREDL